MSKSIFEQTNRTILFEEINSEKLDLLTLVGSGNNITSLDDEKIREIHEHLLVRNFKEFLTKFEPKVYSFFNAASQKVRYSLEKPNGIPDNCITEIPINGALKFALVFCGNNMYFANTNSSGTQAFVRAVSAPEKTVTCTTIQNKLIIRNDDENAKAYMCKIF